MNSKLPPNRVLMRAWAINFRGALAFARHYREHQPALHERWLLRAGQHIAEAIRERDSAPAPSSPLPASP